MRSNKQEEIQRRVGVGASICWPVEKGVSGREDRESMASPAKCKVGRGEYGQQVGYDGGRGREEGRKDGFGRDQKEPYAQLRNDHAGDEQQLGVPQGQVCILERACRKQVGADWSTVSLEAGSRNKAVNVESGPSDRDVSDMTSMSL